jgi:hypothetical protein
MKKEENPFPTKTATVGDTAKPAPKPKVRRAVRRRKSNWLNTDYDGRDQFVEMANRHWGTK